MSSELVAIDSLTKLIYRYPSFYGMEKFDQGVPVIRGEHIGQDGRISTNWGDYWFVTPEYSAQYPKTILAADDIVMSVRGTVGLFARVTESHVGAQISPNLIRLSPDPLKVYPPYFYYALRDERVVAQIAGSVASSAVPALKASDIKSAKIRVLPREQQVSAATALRALDDRITLLRETNVTLEAIAQALFKSWFVDFDPVRAKMEGRAPEGMDEATAALFPDSFEETELGEVPKGWSFSTVGESFILTMGQSPPGDTYNEVGNGLAFYQGRTDFGFRLPTQRIYCTAPTRLAEAGDTLVSVRAPVGDVNMALERCCIGRGVASVRHAKGYHGFTFYAMRSLGERFKNFDSEGTVFGSINKKDFESLPVIRADASVFKVFDDLTSPLDQKIVENEVLLRTLSTLRDTLLPRLISGLLRLPEGVPQQLGADHAN